MKNTMYAIIGFSTCLAGCSTSSDTGVLSMHSTTGTESSNCGATRTLGGGLIGDALDESDSEALLRESPSTLRKVNRGEQLNFGDVNHMLAAGIQEQVIIGQIEATDTHFHLTTSDIIALKNSGVSQNLIDIMIRTGS